MLLFLCVCQRYDNLDSQIAVTAVFNLTNNFLVSTMSERCGSALCYISPLTACHHTEDVGYCLLQLFVCISVLLRFKHALLDIYLRFKHILLDIYLRFKHALLDIYLRFKHALLDIYLSFKHALLDIQVYIYLSFKHAVLDIQVSTLS